MRSARPPARALAILLLALSCVSADAPSSLGESRCTDCDIVLDRVATFSDSADPGVLPDYQVHASRDVLGRTFTVARSRDGVLVFDTAGTIIRRLGTPGSGPGEFRVIRRVLHGPGDSIFVTDWGTGRVTVYAPDLTLVRSHAVVNQPDLILADGSFLIAEQLGGAAGNGYPLHRASPDGAIINSFGADTPQFRPDLHLLQTRRAATSSTGAVWAVAPGRYVLERWNPATGTRVQSVTVRSDWFSEIAAWPADETNRPPAVIETLWEGDDGILWVLLRDADLEWRPPARASEERPIGADEYERTYDWVVEAIDSASGEIVASQRFRHILWGRPGSDVLVSADESTAERSTFSVWRPRLVPRGSGR